MRPSIEFYYIINLRNEIYYIIHGCVCVIRVALLLNGQTTKNFERRKISSKSNHIIWPIKIIPVI